METFIHAYSWVDIHFLLQGLWVTIYVSLISIILSFVLGLIFGLLRYMKIKYLSAIVGFIIDIIRNLPLLLIIFFTYFGLPQLGIVTNPTSASITALVIFEGAMLAEIVAQLIQVKWKVPVQTVCHTAKQCITLLCHKLCTT